MGDKVHITKAGFQALAWDGEAQQYVEEHLPSMVCRLRCACHIDQGVTLGDIFKAVAADRALCDFIGEYSWCNMDIFHAEAEREPPAREDHNNNKLKYLRLSKRFEFHEDLDPELSSGDMDIDFSGLGPPTPDDLENGHAHPDTDGNIYWALDFTPVNELRDIPVRLDPIMEIRKGRCGEETIAKVTAWFSLLEVLDGIYMEISFHGTPAKRDAVMATLQEQVEDIKAGRAKTVPWEEVFPEEKVN